MHKHGARALREQYLAVALLQRAARNDRAVFLFGEPIADAPQPRPAVGVVKRDAAGHFVDIGLRVKIIPVEVNQP